MATGTIKNGLKFTTLLENATPAQYNADDTLIASGVTNYKYLIVTYFYGLSGYEYVRLIDIDNSSRPFMLETIADNAFSALAISKTNGKATLYTNGSAGGVYIAKIVGVN